MFVQLSVRWTGLEVERTRDRAGKRSLCYIFARDTVFSTPTAPLVRGYKLSLCCKLLACEQARRWKNEAGSSDSHRGLDLKSEDKRSSRGGVIVLCSCIRHCTLTASLENQVQKLVPQGLRAGDPFRGYSALD